jgi:hypothetical protein
MTSGKSEEIKPVESMVNDDDGKNRDLLPQSYLHYPNIAKLFSERSTIPVGDARPSL